MPTGTDNPNPATKLPEICCPVCHLYQLYRGKNHTQCIHCGRPIDLRQLQPKLGVKKGAEVSLPKAEARS